MKKFSLVVFPLLFLIMQCTAQSDEAVQQYIDKYKALAMQEEIRTGVPAAITLAQGIFESQAGLSDLALASNNHFGIKCKDTWKGATVYHDDDARGECFRSYSSVEDSYRDHSDFLKGRPNYASLFLLDPADYEAWAYGLKKAGYATNPVYARLIIKKIEDNNLQQYTLLAIEVISTGKGVFVVDNNKSAPVSNALDTKKEMEETAPLIQEPVLVEYSGEANYPAGNFTINQTKVLYATAGTSLFSIASNNNISFEKLLAFNDLESNVDILAQDQLIYLGKKSKESNNKDYHMVARGETIEVIAQKEGVELASIFEYNKMQKGLQPAPGEKVYLKPGRQPYYPKLLAKNMVK